MQVTTWPGTFQKQRLALKFTFKSPDGISLVQSCLEILPVIMQFNVCHPEVFNTYIKYTMIYQSNTTNFYYVFYCIRATCFDSYRIIFRPSKKIDPYLEMLKCAVGSQTLTFFIKICVKFMCHCFLNVQSGYQFLKL